MTRKRRLIAGTLTVMSHARSWKCCEKLFHISIAEYLKAWCIDSILQSIPTFPCCVSSLTLSGNADQCWREFAAQEMGRPAGTIETVLSKDAVATCASRVEIPEKVRDEVLKNAAKLFSDAASADVVISRQILRESLWALEPLVVASPVNIVHADSCFD
eukprot:s975_g30.t1